MKPLYTSFLFLLALWSCQEEKASQAGRESGPAAVEISTGDEEMDSITQKALSTLDTFNKALDSHNPNYDYFALKVAFPTGEGAEHLWVSDIVLKNGTYKGVVNNVPESTKEVDIGDTVMIDKSRISDWMFVESGKLHGGYTVRLLRNRMTEEEKNTFDRENGLILEDD